MAGAAFVFAHPATAIASSQDRAVEAVPQRIQVTLDRIHRLAGNSCAVLHTYEPTAHDPFVDLVVWIADHNGSGYPEPSEVGVLSHSRVLESIVWYPPQDRSEATNVVRRATARQLCSARRRAFDGSRQVLAQAISDLDFDWRRVGELGSELLEITLTWPSEGADGQQRALKHVHVRRIDTVDWSDQ